MTDNRRKNVNWNVYARGSDEITFDGIKVALLMDIRDELQQLNRTLSCPNFLEIPRVLRSIRRNTAKPRTPRLAKRAGVPGKP